MVYRCVCVWSDKVCTRRPRVWNGTTNIFVISFVNGKTVIIIIIPFYIDRDFRAVFSFVVVVVGFFFLQWMNEWWSQIIFQHYSFVMKIRLCVCIWSSNNWKSTRTENFSFLIQNFWPLLCSFHRRKRRRRLSIILENIFCLFVE